MAEGVPGVEASTLQATLAPSLVATLLPSEASARVPVGANVAPRVAKKPVVATSGGQVEATAGVVPLPAGPVLAANHAVAYADAAKGALRTVGATLVRDF